MSSTGVAQVNGIRVHYQHSGQGPLLLLLHGWPQTSYCWRYLIEPLSEKYTVVAPDLRGYGHTDKPSSGYDKRTMAEDMSQLMRSLGFSAATVIGHDRGARLAHRWGLDHPDDIDRLCILDVIPTREVLHRLDRDYANRQWHWLFHAQPDLPELLAGADLTTYLTYFFERWTFNRHCFDKQTVEKYVHSFQAPGAFRASMDDYRASFGADADHDNADYNAGRKLTQPLLVLWGARGASAALPVVDIWGEYATTVHGGEIPECGHFIPEEQPQVLLEHLTPFLPAFNEG